MDNEIEELRDLGLELMFLWCSGRTHRGADSMDAAHLRKRGILIGTPRCERCAVANVQCSRPP